MNTEPEDTLPPPASTEPEPDAPAAANPAPTAGQPGWVPPEADAEFVVGEDGVASAPEWVDKSWAAYDGGPAIAVPMGNLFGSSPQHNTIAKKGDTVKYHAPTESKGAYFEVVPVDPSSGFPHAAPADTYGAPPTQQGQWDPAAGTSAGEPAPASDAASEQQPAS